MNVPPATDGLAQPRTETPPATVSRLIRRVHMFAGLFLGPWMLMYAFSTLVMTHREYVLSLYSSKTPALVKERELDYTRAFPATATREQIGQQILQDLGLDGTQEVSGGKNGKPLVVTRQHALTTRRITFDPATSKIVIEREEFRASTFLARMHRRRGYDNPYALEDTWGFTVEMTAVALGFWSLSGIWLWWELKSTRRWGGLSLVAGWALFALFLVLI